MADVNVVKQGYLSVRRTKNRLASSSYKQRYVKLRISEKEHGKLVEIWESQTSQKEPYRLVLGNAWTVQDKPSNSGKRYAFQLLVGEEVVLTFGCSSSREREDWTNAFDIFRKMALPVVGHPALQAAASTDEKNYFSVFLSRSHSSLEIHCGQYMLSVGNDAICLHWITTAAIAHHWPRKYVQELSINRNSNLVLRVCRAGGSSSNVMEFEFKATSSTTVAILKRWNIILMESIAGDPEQMNFIGKVLNKRVSDTPEGRLTKSFRKRSQSTKERQGDIVKRSGSFSNSRSATLQPRLMNNGMPSPHLQSASNSPQKLSQQNDISKLSGEIGDVAKPSRMQSSPPPLPPRPILDCSSSEEDSDYAYIEEKEVKGPSHSSHSPSQEQAGGDVAERTLEEELEDLEMSMKREKKAKKRKAAQEKKKAVTVAVRPTLQRPPLSLKSKIPFTAADPEDYLEPLSAASQSRPRSTGDYETPFPVHNRSCSEQESSLYCDVISLSQPSIHTYRNSPPRLSPTPEHSTPPALPSRHWHGEGNSSGRNTDDPDISPYAVVRQILPGRILKEPDSHPVSTTPSNIPLKQSSPSQEQRPLGKDPSLPHDQSAVSLTSPTATTPPTSLPSNVVSDPVPASNAPPIPPRSPIKEKLSGSSTSSVASNHSHRSGHNHVAGTRCSKCQRQKRAPVEKALSEHRGQPVPQTMPTLHLEKSSLPDLNSTVGVPENSLQQRRQRTHRGRLTSATESRSSSDGSTSSLQSQNNANYLMVVPDSSNSQPAKGCSDQEDNLQILDDFLQYFDKKACSLTQPDGCPEPQRQVQVLGNPSHTLPLSSHPSSQIANGHVPTRRLNGVKDPPALQRSHTSTAFISHSQFPPHPLHPTKSLLSNNTRAPPPPVPPRSDISLGQSGRQAHFPTPTHAANHHMRPWARSGSSGSFSSTSGDSRSPPALCGSRTRQSSSGSIHSGTPSPTTGPMPHPRSLQHLARHFTHVPEPEGSSTVFIHHLKNNRRVMHSHMV